MVGFKLKAVHMQAIIDHALANKPVEVCGVIASQFWYGGANSRLIRMDNVAENWGIRFEFDEAQQLGVWNDVESRGEIVAAIYHSHTKHDAYPSKYDIAGAAGVDPLTHHIIVSVHGEDPDLQAFMISNGKVTPTEIEVIE
jgi:proteasome lid subunit RPN8/RPN11